MEVRGVACGGELDKSGPLPTSGTWTGVLSTIITSVIFIEFLFGPGFSLPVSSSPENNGEKSNLTDLEEADDF